MGYNFDQITCESCKAFFRRNALDNPTKLKCRSGTNDCIVTLETRKRCKYCRLKKCLDKGLRKEWIMSEEEKRSKKQKIEDNRRLRAMSQSLSHLTSIASIQPDHYSAEDSMEDPDEDSNDFIYSLESHQQTLLKKLDEHYNQAVRLNKSVIKGYDSPCVRYLSDHIECINEPAQISALRLITFFKLTPEFNSLHEDDRLLLVKHNVAAALFVHLCMCTDLNTDIFHEPNTPNDCSYDVKALRNYSDHIHEVSIKLVYDVQALCSNDRLIMKLLLLITLFSKGADTYESYTYDSLKICSYQNLFVDLLVNYINVRFDAHRSPMICSQLIFSILKCQSLARELKETLANKSNSINEFAPLMQSVLQTSS